MSPERNSLKAEVWKTPFREELSHQILFSQVEEGVDNVGKKISRQWSEMVEAGMGDALMSVQKSLGTEPIRLKFPGQAPHDYYLNYEGAGIDTFVQPVDIFKLVRQNDEGEGSAVVNIATYRGENTRYKRLVSYSATDEDADVAQHFLHFNNGKLFILRQIAQPKVLFPDLEPTDEKQFVLFRLGHSPAYNDRLLIFGTGIHYEDLSSQYLYSNLGGDLVRTFHLRVEDPYAGDVELYDLYESGKITNVGQVNLPQAVERIGNFQAAA